MNYLLPLSIIGVGIMLLLGNLNILSLSDIWRFLKTWWLAIIILWGIHMLVMDMDRRKANRRGDPPAIDGP